MEDNLKIQEIREKRKILAEEIRQTKWQISQIDKSQSSSLSGEDVKKIQFQVASVVYPIITGLLAGIGAMMTALGAPIAWAIIVPGMVMASGGAVYSWRQVFKINKKQKVQPKSSNLIELEDKLEELEMQDHKLYKELVECLSQQGDFVKNYSEIERAEIAEYKAIQDELQK